MTAPPALTCENVTVAYDDEAVLHDLSFSLPQGSLIGILGPNGAGKSTLFKAALGLLPCDRGSIRLLGHRPEQGRRFAAYVPQQEEIDRDFPVLVEDVVMMGRYPHMGWVRPLPRSEDREAVTYWLEQVGMDDLRHRQIGRLSGGQQQRVFLARALAQEARLFFLDEPFVGVDVTSEETIFRLLKRVRSEGRTALVILHDLEKAARHFDYLLLLNCRIMAAGPPEEVLQSDVLRRTYLGDLASVIESAAFSPRAVSPQ